MKTMFPIIDIEQSKVFDAEVIARYMCIPKEWLPQVTVTIKGKYRTPGFEGTFEGYNSGHLTIKKVMIEGKPYYYNKRLRNFLERDFLKVISTNDNSK